MPRLGSAYEGASLPPGSYPDALASIICSYLLVKRLLAVALGAGSAVVSDGRWRAGFDYGARTAWDSGLHRLIIGV